MSLPGDNELEFTAIAHSVINQIKWSEQVLHDPHQIGQGKNDWWTDSYQRENWEMSMDTFRKNNRKPVFRKGWKRVEQGLEQGLEQVFGARFRTGLEQGLRAWSGTGIGARRTKAWSYQLVSSLWFKTIFEGDGIEMIAEWRIYPANPVKKWWLPVRQTRIVARGRIWGLRITLLIKK